MFPPLGRTRYSAQLPKTSATTVVIVIVMMIIAAFMAITAWVVQDSRHASLRQAEQQERNIALWIRDEIAQDLNMTDQVLQSTIRKLKYPGLNAMDPQAQRAILFDYVGENSKSDTVVTDQAGSIIYQSSFRLPKNFSVAGRPHFETLKRSDIGLVFSPPMRSMLDGTWVIVAARRINNNDGSFGGVVMRRIPLSVFRDMFEKLDIGTHGTITFVSTDGPMIDRRPYRVEDIGRDMSGTVVLKQAALSNSGVFQAPGRVDGIDRLYYFEKIGNYPFVLAVGLPTQDIYAEWLRKTIVFCLVLCALILVAVFLSFFLWREVGRSRRAEAVSRNSESEVITLFDNVADHAIYYLDKFGKVASWNKISQSLKGYSYEEIIGTHFGIFFTTNDFVNGEPDRLLEDAQKQGRIEVYAWRVRKDKSQFFARVAITTIYDELGNVIRYAKVVHDLTVTLAAEAQRAILETRERELMLESNARLEKLSRHLGRSRDQAKQATEAKSRFLTSVTHELRTPLNGILGYAQLLSLQGGLTATQAANVKAMEEAGKHLLGMINAVLDLSQIESDRIEMHSGDIEVQLLAQAGLNLVAPAAVDKGLALLLTTAPSAPSTIVGDSIRLRQVLVNLLGNAVKFTTSGSVELRLLRAEHHNGLRVEVADTGPGIASEHRERLFHEFERFGDEAITAKEGSGLGLAITARLVERMAGRLGYADNPGGGSIFWVEFPESSALPEAVAQAVRGSDMCPQSSKLRILVVDDVAMNRDIASAFLRLGGHDAVCVDSGQAAIEAARDGDFAVILMDVRMPGMDGLEATRSIRKLDGKASLVPIVAMTAQAFSEQIEQCRQAGMDAHIAKPFQYDALLNAVSNAAIGRAREDSQEPFVQPPRPAPHLPVLDEAIYNETVPFLDSEALARHLDTLVQRGELLLVQLRGSDMLKRLTSLADAAHALGGAAGTFGFVRLAQTAKTFERSVGLDAPEIAEHAELLIDAVEASLLKISELLRKNAIGV